MRILLLNYEYPPLGGGAGIATAALAQELAARGVAVDVVTAGAGAAGERRTSARLEGTLAEERLSLYRVPCRRSGIHEASMLDAASYLVAAFPVVRRLLRIHTYDAVHIFFSLPTGAVLPFLNLRGAPVVVSLRGSDVPGYDPHNALMQRAHRLLAPLTRWIWRRADRVVAGVREPGPARAADVPRPPLHRHSQWGRPAALPSRQRRLGLRTHAESAAWPWRG